MSLPVFFASAPLPQVGETTELTGPEARHAVTVKRIGPGELIQLIDGAGRWAEIEVTETVGKDHLTGVVLTAGECERPDPYVIVVQALPKAERSELAVDLATQAGADEIIPWQAARCIAKWQGAKRSKGVQKWQSAAAAAAKQSRRVTVPEVWEPVSTAQLAQLIDGHTAVVLHEEASQPLAQLAPGFSGTVFLIVGPEGGIGDEEVALLRSAGAQPVVLGPQVLRTASAAMVALSVIGAATSRWGE